MKPLPYKLILRGCLATLPLATFVLLAESFLWLAGETVPTQSAALDPLRHNYPSAYLPAFVEQQFSRFHHERINHLRPQILVTGSSRVMRFRDEMFLPDAVFYNSGRLINSVRHMEDYIASLPADYAPETLLVGLDSWWFNGHPGGDPPSTDAVVRRDIRPVSAHFQAYRDLLRCLFQRKISLDLAKKILARQDNNITRFGLLAWDMGGFRNDGSYREFVRLEPSDPSHTNRVRMLSVEDKILARRPDVDPQLFERFIKALQTLEQRGSTIVIFAPPYNNHIRRIFKEDPVQASYFKSFQRKTTTRFRQLGWIYFDGSDPASLGLNDNCMQDQHHPMETCLVAFLHKISADPVICQQLHLDHQRLETILSDPNTTPWYPNYAAGTSSSNLVAQPNLHSAR